MLILQVVSDCSSLVLFNSLVKVSARVADITCITQVTLKMINNALLIHKGWLVFPHFDFVLDLSTCVHWADSCIDLPTEVCKLSACCICRFLVLKRQHDSDWGFIVVRNLLLCLRFLRYFESNKLADGRLYEFVQVAQTGKEIKLEINYALCLIRCCS